MLVDLELLMAPIEQREAEKALQRLNPAAQRRRGQGEFLRRGLDPSRFGQLARRPLERSGAGGASLLGLSGIKCCDAQACRNSACDARGDLGAKQFPAAF